MFSCHLQFSFYSTMGWIKSRGEIILKMSMTSLQIQTHGKRLQSSHQIIGAKWTTFTRPVTTQCRRYRDRGLPLSSQKYFRLIRFLEREVDYDRCQWWNTACWKAPLLFGKTGSPIWATPIFGPAALKKVIPAFHLKSKDSRLTHSKFRIGFSIS